MLEVYAEPYDPQRPKVCFDETPKQLIAETRLPLPAQAGQVERYDYEYQRNGTCNLFMFFEPERGWRHIAVTERRTLLDFAQQMKWLVDEAYPEADGVRVIWDTRSVNTHRAAALYEAFPPAEARRILKRREFHYTPKHDSWLNMAELELGGSAGNVGIGASATKSRWRARLRRLKRNATRRAPKFIGASRRKTLASSFIGFIHPFHVDGVVVAHPGETRPAQPPWPGLRR